MHNQPIRALDRQREIYLRGFAGQRPTIPLDPHELELAAEASMQAKAYAYIAGGAGRETTMSSNRSAFDRISIVPRMLRDVDVRDTSISLFDRRLPAPLLLAPIGVSEMAHPEGDLAVAKAAAALGVPHIISNQSSWSMEEIAAVSGNNTRWFQLYWSRSRELVASFVQRAERAGYEAIVVTLDTTLLGWRTRDLQLGYLPFLEGKGIAQYTSDPVFMKLLEDFHPAKTNRRITLTALWRVLRLTHRLKIDNLLTRLRTGKPLRAVQQFTAIYSNPSITWSDIRYLRSLTKLPILVKGILHPDDASEALQCGVNGIIVSNHGGRQVDGAIATMEALPGIVSKVNGRIPVLLDSGIRCGADVFKALAMGASAVCLGRPYVYGLALAGSEGVQEVVNNLQSEFELTMALAGCRSVSEISPELISRS